VESLQVRAGKGKQNQTTLHSLINVKGTKVHILSARPEKMQVGEGAGAIRHPLLASRDFLRHRQVSQDGCVSRVLLLGIAAVLIATTSGLAGYVLGRAEVSACQEDLRTTIEALERSQSRAPDDSAVYGVSGGSCLR